MSSNTHAIKSRVAVSIVRSCTGVIVQFERKLSHWGKRIASGVECFFFYINAAKPRGRRWRWGRRADLMLNVIKCNEAGVPAGAKACLDRTEVKVSLPVTRKAKRADGVRARAVCCRYVVDQYLLVKRSNCSLVLIT